MTRRLALLLGLSFLAGPARGETVDYVLDVKPILASRCYSCHSALRQRSGLRLDVASLLRQGGDRGAAIVPGKSAESLLLHAIGGLRDVPRMPPREQGEPLTAREIGVLKTWIDQGAKAPVEKIPEDPRKHWAFRPPVRAALPAIRNRSWGRNAVDVFIAAEHEKHGLQPRPPAAKTVLLRRVYLDLIGLPPTREELHAFLADASEDAYEKVVDRLLASPRYGERWGRHWMDVWRYSDWAGFGAVEVRDSQPHVWHWRDWIIEALNRDKGYDRMVKEMLAGDELAPEALPATGFLARHYWSFDRNVWMERVVEHTAKAFVGITMNCARCHDHMFDPISQQEYYAFRAFFEPYKALLDPLPGRFDTKYDGLAHAYDADVKAETFLFIRGDESRVDKSRRFSPGVPAALGGLPIKVEAPSAELVARYTAAAAEQSVMLAGPALTNARAAVPRSEADLAAATQASCKAQAELAGACSRLGTIASLPPLMMGELLVATAKAERAAKARTEADEVYRDRRDELKLALLDMPLADARLLAVASTLQAEIPQKDPKARDHAASAAVASQRRVAVLELHRQRLFVQRAVALAQQKADQVAREAAAPKATDQQKAAVQQAVKQLTAERDKLAALDKSLAKAEQDALGPPGRTYTPVNKAAYPATSTGRRSALARWIADPRNPLTARVAMNHIWLRHFGKPLVATVFDFGRNGQPPTHPALLDWLTTEFVARGWSMKHMHGLLVTSNTYRMSSAHDARCAAIDPDNRFLWQMNALRMEAELVRDSILHVAGRLDLTMGGPDLDHNLGLTTHRRSLYYRSANEKQVEFLAVFDAANVNECYARTESIVPQQALALANSPLSLAQSRLLARRLMREVGGAASSAQAELFVSVAFEQVLGRLPTAPEKERCARFLREQAARLADPKQLTVLPGAPSAVAPAADPQLCAREDLILVLLNHNDFLTIR